jgi:hypothetical protein
MLLNKQTGIPMIWNLLPDPIHGGSIWLLTRHSSKDWLMNPMCHLKGIKVGAPGLTPLWRGLTIQRDRESWLRLKGQVSGIA